MTTEEAEKVLSSAEKLIARREERKKNEAEKSKEVVKEVAEQPKKKIPAAKLDLDPDKVWQVINVYKRPGEAWQKVMFSARYTLNEHGAPSVKVFAHDHAVNEDCVKLCKEVKLEEGS